MSILAWRRGLAASVMVAGLLATGTPVLAHHHHHRHHHGETWPLPGQHVWFGWPYGNQYSPRVLTVGVNEPVIFEGNFRAHPLVSDAGVFPTIDSGSVVRLVFNRAGTVHYHCGTHANEGMNGVIFVVDRPGAAAVEPIPPTPTETEPPAPPAPPAPAAAPAPEPPAAEAPAAEPAPAPAPATTTETTTTTTTTETAPTKSPEGD